MRHHVSSRHCKSEEKLSQSSQSPQRVGKKAVVCNAKSLPVTIEGEVPFSSGQLNCLPLTLMMQGHCTQRGIGKISSQSRVFSLTLAGFAIFARDLLLSTSDRRSPPI